MNKESNYKSTIKDTNNKTKDMLLEFTVGNFLSFKDCGDLIASLSFIVMEVICKTGTSAADKISVTSFSIKPFTCSITILPFDVIERIPSR